MEAGASKYLLLFAKLKNLGQQILHTPLTTVKI